MMKFISSKVVKLVCYGLIATGRAKVSSDKENTGGLRRNRQKRGLRIYMTSKGSGKPAHLHSLTRLL